MTAQDVIDGVRDQLNDEDESNERWIDEKLLRYVDEAQKRIRHIRPDLFLSAADAMQTAGTIDAVGDVLILDEDNRQSLVDLVCSRALFQDSSDTMNVKRAGSYRKAAMDELRVPSG